MDLQEPLLGSAAPGPGVGMAAAAHAAAPAAADGAGGADARATPVQISFEHVNFKPGKRTVLDDVSGFFGPGKLIGITGPSGAGKTSLLNLLAGVVPLKGATGRVFVNGQAVARSLMRKVSVYCPQGDVLMPNLTPREALWDAARLRLPARMNARKRVRKVDGILTRMGLTPCADTVAGTPGGDKGLSGGQRRRLSLALELVTEPMVMFLDEITSGLDGPTAFTCVSNLRALVRRGHTVVCVIHQPNSKLFHLFDEVVLMVDGHIVFHDATDQVVPYFQRHGLECGEHENPADFLIEVVAGQPTETLQTFVEDYRQRVAAEWEQRTVRTPITYPKDRYPNQHKEMFRVLLERALRSLSRDRIATRFRLFSHVLVALIMGLIYFQMDSGIIGMRDRLSLLFFSALFLVLNAVVPTVMSFQQERPVVMKEHRNNRYALRPYFLAQTVADIPGQIVLPVAFVCILYYMAGLANHADRFLGHMLTMILLTLVGQSLGVLISTSVLSLKSGMFVAPMIALPNFLFCGFLATLDNIPGYLSWLQYVSFARYGYENLVLMEFRNSHFTVGGVAFPGNRVIGAYSFEKDSFARNCAVLVCFAVALRMSAYVVLRYRLKGRFS